MKKASLILASLLAAGTFALAGQETYSGKEMKQVAPMPPPCPTWTGFYVGGFGGYKFGSSDISLHLNGDWEDPFFDEDVDAIEHRLGRDLDPDGAEAGGLLGYNYQLPSNWVFGLEAAGGYLWLRDSDTSNRFALNSTEDEYHTSSSLKSHYLFTVGPRIGYAFCKWMPYVTGGVAIGDIDFKQRITEHDTFFREGGSESETKVGWMVGGGMEYAITDHWRARLQYQYIDLGEADFHHDGGPDPLDVNFTGHSEAELREHNVSAAIIYGF